LGFAGVTWEVEVGFILAGSEFAAIIVIQRFSESLFGDQARDEAGLFIWWQRLCNTIPSGKDRSLLRGIAAWDTNMGFQQLVI
jgi:hypothetical protein